MRPLEDMGEYAVVVIDPPWKIALGPVVPEKQWGKTAPDLPYEAMSLSEIAAMPIPAVLAADALVFLWTTNRLLFEAGALLTAWGLEYRFTMVWHKNDGMQTPGNPRQTAEFVVVGRKGKPAFRTTQGFATANYWKRGGHSEKPEAFYDLLRRVTDGPRLDVFARRAIAGFVAWGNEAPEGEASPDHYQTILGGVL